MRRRDAGQLRGEPGNALPLSTKGSEPVEAGRGVPDISTLSIAEAVLEGVSVLGMAARRDAA